MFSRRLDANKLFDRDNMKKMLKIAIYIFLGLALIIAILVIYYFSQFGYQVKCEYVTWEVIRKTNKYIEDNQGRWPKSWSDIGLNDKYSKYSTIDFSLDPFTATEDEILSAIKTKSKQDPFYHDPKKLSIQLYKTIASIKDKNSNEADRPNRRTTGPVGHQ
ncbi:MAG TPA: hypothetical protein DCZ94_06345 [Lentisphaeria bacterium]|nr:MAG: hypothetical protein A2X48_05750 [Lentisphaerae bacterium GWF2_49_21]HBC86557.1 hypothetical protein [Lentisphaeria bacterium]